MKQIQFAAFGQPSNVARCVEVAEVGRPSAWELLVDVEAFPINVSDLAILAGRYGTLPKLPATIGMEAVGRVVECGSSVTTISPGDRVVFLANHNWSERRKVPLAAVHKVDSLADVLQLSMLKVNPATAHMLLSDYSDLIEGDWVIQTAPLSTVGQCVLQIAKQRGIRTINVVRRPETAQRIMALGGSVVVEDGPDLAARVAALIHHAPVRLALDAVAGAGISRIAECLIEGATIINYGMLSTEPCVLAAEQTIFRNITLCGFWLSKILSRLSQHKRTELFDELGSMVVCESLKMDIDAVFPMEDIQAALARAEQGGRNGKVIVTTKAYQPMAALSESSR